MNEIPTKDQLLTKYRDREPKLFVQYDGFNPPTHVCGDDGIDSDGHEIWGGLTYELMHGAQVRVLVEPMAANGDVVVLLRKIADWIERDGVDVGTLFRLDWSDS